MRAVQYFSDEYLERCRGMTAEEILRFLDDFRRLHGSSPAKSKLISIKGAGGPVECLQGEGRDGQHPLPNPDQRH